MARRGYDQITIAPDGRSIDEQPAWRPDFPIGRPQDHYVERRESVHDPDERRLHRWSVLDRGAELASAGGNNCVRAVCGIRRDATVRWSQEGTAPV
jgi:hypothetical protein